MAIRLKRWLYLGHRWLGVALCLFLAMWFFSGVVMMYVGYPKLTEAERLARLPELAPFSSSLLSPAEALGRAGIEGELRALRLSAARAGEPVYQAVLADGRQAQADARSDAAPRGSGQPPVDETVALASARVFAGPGVGLAYAGTLDEDAFTHSRALDRHRPLHRVALQDADGTWVYVSGTTGEVVRDATRRERGWNYLGAWIHWLYPFRGNVFDAQWANIVNVLAIAGLALTMTGAIVGILRWRFAGAYRSGSRSPYPGRMMRWHHTLGLFFALITLGWLFSGLMSMGPWGFLRDPGPALDADAMQGPPLTAASLAASPALLLAQAPEARELAWARRLGQRVVLAHGAAGSPRMIDADTATPVRFEPAAIAASAARLLDAPLARTELLTSYDTYYYTRAPHTMTGGRDRPLPVIRAFFADGRATWVHLDASTAEILGHSTRNGRLRRWLFQMLHSWDWLPLLERRPLWDAVLLLLSAGGLALSLTGVVIGVRRLGARIRSAWRRTARISASLMPVPSASSTPDRPPAGSPGRPRRAPR